MGIKLSDFIKDTHNVFNKEEAEMIYLAAGYVDLGNEHPDYIEALNRGYKGVSEND